MHHVVFYLLLATAAYWLLFAAVTLRNVLAVRQLPELIDLPSAPCDPRVSVIIAARNESRRIEETVRRLLLQRGVQLEIIVADDRSSDGTREILRRLAAEDPRVRVVEIDELPAGWLGKCYACWRAAERASSPWLLFTDADIYMQPDLLARAIATAGSDEADHLTLLPGVNTTALFPRACLLAWSQSLVAFVSPADINRDRGRNAVGVGAFNLVRREAYERIGGHEPLKLEVADDLKLGLLLRRAGFRQRVYGGARQLEAEWATTVPEIIQALEKNWFAALGYRYLLAFFVLALVFATFFTSVLGPLLDPLWGWLPLTCMLLTIAPAAVMARNAGWPLAAALLSPLGFFVFGLAGLNSVWKTWRQGGIRWRETRYSLDELRKGRVK